MPDATSGFVPVPGGQLYYDVTGSGPAVLFIHAGVADHRMWDDQVAALAPTYRVIRYDTRGYGQTITTEAVPYSNRQDARAVLDHVGVARAVVVGCSRGGTIALDVTLEYPDRVAALVHVAGGLSGFESQSTQAELALDTEMERLWEARDFERLADLEVRFWADGPTQPAGRAPAGVRQRLRAMIVANYANGYYALSPEPTVIPLDPPAVGRLAEVRVPTLAVIGGLDASGAQAAGAYLAAGVQGARKVVFPDAAHLPSMEKPDAFNRLLLDFLAALP